MSVLRGQLCFMSTWQKVGRDILNLNEDDAMKKLMQGQKDIKMKKLSKTMNKSRLSSQFFEIFLLRCVQIFMNM